MYVLGHPCINAGAGDGQGDAAVDVDGVYGELGSVPQIFGIPEFLHILRAKVFQEVVAGSMGMTVMERCRSR